MKSIWKYQIPLHLLLVLWVYAFANKIQDTSRFIKGIAVSFPGPYFPVAIAWILLSLEAITAIFLLWKHYQRKGLYLSLLLLLLFTCYISYLLWSGAALPCSCGGVLEQLGWRDHLIFNLIFITLNCIALYQIPHAKNIAQSGVAENL